MIKRVFKSIYSSSKAAENLAVSERARGPLDKEPIGLIAGSKTFPIRFIEEAHLAGHPVHAVCHLKETLPEVAELADGYKWIRVGELGAIIKFFKKAGVNKVALAGGIDRVRLFGGVKLDARGAALLLRLRSAKDDVIMRGIADELSGEGIEVIDSTIFLKDCLVSEGVLTRSSPSSEELVDIEVGIAAIKSMSDQDIGQLVVVREGVIVAVEAVEGSDACIRRGGELGGKGAVVVKFAKTTQDMRFDVPTIGPRTIKTMAEVGVRVLAVEAGRCLVLDEDEMLSLANTHKIAIVGCPPLA